MSAEDEAVSVSRIIKASARSIYRALLDPCAVEAWRAPDGMKARVLAFEPRLGGAFRMALAYTSEQHPVPGKTSAHMDVVRGQFRELVADRCVVEEIAFESDDPSMAGTMELTTTLTPVPDGTRVTISVRNAPAGVRASDHEIGISSTLQNLADFIERPRNRP